MYVPIKPGPEGQGCVKFAAALLIESAVPGLATVQAARFENAATKTQSSKSGVIHPFSRKFFGVSAFTDTARTFAIFKGFESGDVGMAVLSVIGQGLVGMMQSIYVHRRIGAHLNRWDIWYGGNNKDSQD